MTQQQQDLLRQLNIENMPWSFIEKLKLVKRAWAYVDRAVKKTVMRTKDETDEFPTPANSLKFSLPQCVAIARGADRLGVWDEFEGMRMMLRILMTIWVNHSDDAHKFYKWANRYFGWNKLEFGSWYVVTKTIAALVKKWPVMFQQRVGFARWERVTELKNLIGMVYTPEAVLDKTGKRYNVLGEVLRMQHATGVNIKESDYKAYVRRAVATMTFTNRYQPFDAWLSDPNNYAREGADPVFRVETVGGERIRITKRATQLAVSKDRFREWVLDRKMPEYKALFKIDVGAGRVIYTGDLAVFTLFAYMNDIFGNPISSAPWSTIGKKGQSFVDFYSKLIVLARKGEWYLIPKDISNFDFHPECAEELEWFEAWYEQGRQAVINSAGVLADELEMLHAKLRALIVIGVILLPMVSDEDRAEALTEYGSQYVKQDGKSVEVTWHRGLLSGKPWTAQFGSTFNVSISCKAADGVNSAIGKFDYTIDAAAGDDAQDRSGSIQAVYLAQAEYDALAFTVHPDKGFVDRNRTELLRWSISPRGMSQYAARAIPKLFQSDVPSQVKTARDAISDWTGQCKELRLRGADLDWVQVLFNAGVTVLSQVWRVPKGWLLSPSWSGGCSGVCESRGIWSGAKQVVPNVNLSRYVIDPSWSRLAIETRLQENGLQGKTSEEMVDRLVYMEMQNAAQGILDPYEDARRSREYAYQLGESMLEYMGQQDTSKLNMPSAVVAGTNVSETTTWIGLTTRAIHALWGRAPKDFRWQWLELDWRMRSITKIKDKLKDVGIMYGISALIDDIKNSLPGGALLDVLNGHMSVGVTVSDPPSLVLGYASMIIEQEIQSVVRSKAFKKLNRSSFNWVYSDAVRAQAHKLWRTSQLSAICDIAA